MGDENEIVSAYPSLIRTRFLQILFCLILFAFAIYLLAFVKHEEGYNLYGAGVVAIVAVLWYFLMFIQNRARRLNVTDERTIITQGIISRRTSEVIHGHVRNITVEQGILDRIFGVGTLGLSSAGQSDVEISFEGLDLENIDKIKAIIDKHRTKDVSSSGE